MNVYSTTATVEANGQIHLIEAPFSPGTEVEVVIREKIAEASASPPGSVTPRASIREVFERIQGRNTESVGPLRREEIYDRAVFRRH